MSPAELAAFTAEAAAFHQEPGNLLLAGGTIRPASAAAGPLEQIEQPGPAAE